MASKSKSSSVSNSQRRDRLLEIEASVRKLWEDEDVFRAESCEKAPKEGEKFYSTFPFPYMNDRVDIGHAFTLPKIDFASGYHRLRGANVLLPFGFHCTGEHITTSADKLSREIQRFGNPPVFPVEDNPALPVQYKGKKPPAAAKSGGQVHQWEIMRSFGLTDSEIAKFQEPSEWVNFLPGLAVEDLKAYGLGCDWRRSFVTTDANPFFDAFVRWQMRKLKNLEKIVENPKYKIVADDESGIGGKHNKSLEYLLVKMEVLLPFPLKLSPLEGKKLYLAAATSRPEIIYGQTNVWVSPNGNYAAYEVNESDVYIVSETAAHNLAGQNLLKVPLRTSCLVHLTGHDLIGLTLKSPLSKQQNPIYVLPNLTSSTNNGTGIFISTPDFQPDDYMAVCDLKTKMKTCFQTWFDVKDEWLLIDIEPTINLPTFQSKSAAEEVCRILRIRSQLDEDKLRDAKYHILKEGYSEGTMLTGEFVGKKVHTIRPVIKTQLIESGEAVLYSEPEKPVMSRSGDDCAGAFTDQWYITYGEEEWRKMAEECLSNMNLYSKDIKKRFENTLSCLNQWTCSSSSGLGTRIPWDEHFLVESLSDSTLYMAYYTVAHFFHEGDMYKGSNSLIRPQQMSDEVWEYLFCDGQYPQSSDIPKEVLSKMKQEFVYWYPLDLRVSRKDLIQNHLTFFIYNHTALMAKRNWPRGIRCNGHIMLKSEKMSKSTGYFKTLQKAIEEYSATGTRFSLADAGDGIDDANFVPETAHAAIFRLTKELTWMEEVLADESSLRVGPLSTYADKVFENEMNITIRLTQEAYRNYMFREALKNGFYDLQAARDEYRLTSNTDGMNRDLILRFMDVQTRLITPICPHFADYVWREILKKEGCVLTAGWPASDDPNLALGSTNKYLQDSIVLMRKLLQEQLLGSKKAAKKGAQVTSLSKQDLKGLVYVSERYEGWRAQCLEILQRNFNQATQCFTSDQEIVAELKETLQADGQEGTFEQNQKFIMPFLKFKKNKAIDQGSEALDLKSPFEELNLFRKHKDLIRQKLGLTELEICSASDPEDVAKAGQQVPALKQNLPFPMNPTAIFLNR